MVILISNPKISQIYCDDHFYLQMSYFVKPRDCLQEHTWRPRHRNAFRNTCLLWGESASYQWFYHKCKLYGPLIISLLWAWIVSLGSSLVTVDTALKLYIRLLAHQSCFNGTLPINSCKSTMEDMRADEDHIENATKCNNARTICIIIMIASSVVKYVVSKTIVLEIL